MRYLLLLLVSFSMLTALPQPAPETSDTSPSTYAVVVGISKYRNEIPPLQFADKDAEEFAAYLKSTAGGSTIEKNITLLLNEAATTAAVVNATQELLVKCKKNDIVYFYFSGHGDLENKTVHRNGFLICYDSPPHNYINMAFRVEDLNDIANTLSATTGAHVVLITDACHSGKLAGSSNKGNLLVGEQLRAVRDKEVRITSCKDNQLANEKEEWGGGRGVFSYYLINGLKGLGDKTNDGLVTVNEIKEFMQSALAQDPVLKRENLEQTPVINGKLDFILAKVDSREAMMAKQQIEDFALTTASAASIDISAMDKGDLFFSLLKSPVANEHLKEILQQNIPAGQVGMELLNRLWQTTEDKNTQEMLGSLGTSLVNDADELKSFNSKLVVAFVEQAQQVIDEYLQGDEAELERRRYYNSNKNTHDLYVRMLAIAEQLSPPETFLSQMIKVNHHYFSGVVKRLSLPLNKNQQPIIKAALADQLKALELEENAAYIYNELGILNNLLNKKKEAEKYFLKAVEISPTWAVPHSNLAGLYIDLKKYTQSQEHIQKAKDLQPTLQNTHIAEAFLAEKKNNLLLSEELYRKSIKMNSRHYLPFERLGIGFISTTDYALADSFLKEAEIRKAGYFFEKTDRYPLAAVAAPMLEMDTTCYFDTSKIKQSDAIGHFVWGMSYWKDYRPKAEYHLKISIQADPLNPLAFHYLGKLLYDEKRWQEAEIIFKIAKANYLQDDLFKKYCDSISVIPFPNSECLVALFKTKYYDKVEDLFLLASAYEQWNHYEDALREYSELINDNAELYVANVKRWRLLEKLGRYPDAENMIQAFTQHAHGYPDELLGFYVRMNEREPTNAYWLYKRGTLLHRLAEQYPDNYPYDKMEIHPDTDSVVVKAWTDRMLRQPYSWYVPGADEYIIGAMPVESPRSEGISDLLRADSLNTLGEDATADIMNKVGDLYAWMELPSYAAVYYRKAVNQKPGNTNIRMKLADVLDQTYQYNHALQLLDSLNTSKEINHTHLLRLARYTMHRGKYDSAQRLLAQAKALHPFKVYNFKELQARLSLLSGDKNAIARYIALQTGDKDADAHAYTLSRLYAASGRTEEALTWLEKALEKGFNHKLVLNYDSRMEPLKKHKKWTSLRMKYMPEPPAEL